MAEIGWLNEIKAIGWDLDGTLYPSSDLLNQEIERQKMEWIGRVNDWGGERSRKEFDQLHHDLGSSTKTLTALGVDGVEFFTRVWDEIELERFIHPDPKLVGLFDQLREMGKFRMFVLSNSNRLDQIEKKLELIGIDPALFELVVSTVVLGKVKPDLIVFEHCLEQLKLSANEVVYVGDREGTDIRGAKGAGMRSVFVGGVSPEADVSCDNVYDVVKLFLNN